MMDRKLLNKMLGETVIYMDRDLKPNAAMIIDFESETTVNLLVTTPTGTTFIARSVQYSNVDAKDRWWRRIKQ